MLTRRGHVKRLEGGLNDLRDVMKRRPTGTIGKSMQVAWLQHLEAIADSFEHDKVQGEIIEQTRGVLQADAPSQMMLKRAALHVIELGRKPDIKKYGRWEKKKKE